MSNVFETTVQTLNCEETSSYVTLLGLIQKINLPWGDGNEQIQYNSYYPEDLLTHVVFVCGGVLKRHSTFWWTSKQMCTLWADSSVV